MYHWKKDGGHGASAPLPTLRFLSCQLHHFQPPQGFAVSLQVQDPGDAALRFRTLSDGGTVTMPFAKTFFSKGFGMCVDKFGTPWMVNSPLEGM